MKKQKLVVLSGAGISAESGIKTFRDADGLWEGYDIMEVATFEGFQKNPELVLNFYNQRRKQLKEAEPNQAHNVLAELESQYDVTIITQNVDDLHERAGSTKVLHLHGELFKARSVENDFLIYDWKEDITTASKNDRGHNLRPHIVWFGEAVPEMERATKIMQNADVVLIIGTSLQVYPAAGLIDDAANAKIIYYIDQNPADTSYFTKNIQIIPGKASEGVYLVANLLKKRL